MVSSSLTRIERILSRDKGSPTSTKFSPWGILDGLQVFGQLYDKGDGIYEANRKRIKKREIRLKIKPRRYSGYPVLLYISFTSGPGPALADNRSQNGGTANSVATSLPGVDTGSTFVPQDITNFWLLT